MSNYSVASRMLFVFVVFASLVLPTSWSSMCPDGFHVETFNDQQDPGICAICPLGHACTNDTKHACEGHQYQDRPQQSECKNCSTGYYTPNNVVCIQCRENEFCPQGLDKPILCSPNTYFDWSIEGCANCPSDHFCRHGKKHLCPSGHFVYHWNDDADSLCLECPVGYECPGDGQRYKCINASYADLPGQSTCDTCPEGFFTDNSSVACLQCSQNDDCPDGVNRFRCAEGTYFDGAVCAACPLGFYCIDAAISPCTPGTYSNGSSSSSCTDCPKGTFREQNQGRSVDDCTICPIGYYQHQTGETQCIPCPAGTWSNVTGVTDLSDCVDCPAGTYQENTAESDPNSCTTCSSGYESSSGSGACTICSVGTAAPAGSSSCEPCAAGSYADEEGLEACKLCPAGTYNTPDDPSPRISESVCTPCTSGGSAVRGANSSDVCTECDPGYYSRNVSCIACPMGSYTEIGGVRDCDLCPKGTELPREGATQNDCSPCQPGSYADEEGTGICNPCLPGQYATEVGAVEDICLNCSAGYFSEAGSTSCDPCPPGTFSTEQSGECTPCPLGTFSETYNTTECTPCDLGSYSDELGRIQCKLCPEGTYNDQLNAISLQNCTLCPKGTFSSTVSATSELHCESCPRGTFCDERGMSEAKDCPKGTYSSSEASTSINNCISCPKGTFSSREAAVSVDDCEPCPLGRYGTTEGAVFVQECTLCPPGTFSTTNAASNIDACESCPTGTYSPRATSSCINCPLGTYNENEGSANATDCIPCPNSQTTANTGSNDPELCIGCSKGEYMSSSLICYPCPRGTYFDVDARDANPSATGSTAWCKPCGRGNFQPEEAQIGEESCQICPQGTYGPDTANAEYTECGKGYYSEVEGAVSSDVCQACPIGTWSENMIANSSSTCLSCSPGTFSNTSAAQSSSTCTLCPLGYKSESPGSSTCVQCETEGCIGPGYSFELKSSSALDESVSVFDPKSVDSAVANIFLTLKLSIPFGVFGLCALIALLVILILLCFYRCRVVSMFHKLDFFFTMNHYVPTGESQINRPSVLGGIFSVMVLVGFMGFFTSILMDFIGNNKIVLENFLLENTESVQGEFMFQSMIVGRHGKCDSDVTLSGFEIEDYEVRCEQGVFTEDQLDACLCTYTCLDCAPVGNSHTIQFDYDAHMMTQLIMFTIEVPHYVPGRSYIVNGSMNSGNSIFTGKGLEEATDSPSHIFSFSLNNARYIAISNFAAFTEIFGFNQETETKGYTIQLTGKFPGPSKPDNDDFVLSKGMRIVLDIQQSFGTYVSRETVRENLFTFFAQVLTILSMLTAVGAFTLSFLEEKSEPILVKLGLKEKRPDHPVHPQGFYPAYPHRHIKSLDDMSSHTSDGEQDDAERPRNVEPLVLQKWRKQIKQRRQVVSSDMTDQESQGGQLESTSTSKTSTVGDKGSEALRPPEEAAMNQEVPRVPIPFKYDPTNILQDLKNKESESNNRSSASMHQDLLSSFQNLDENRERTAAASEQPITSIGQTSHQPHRKDAISRFESNQHGDDLDHDWTDDSFI